MGLVGSSLVTCHLSLLLGADVAQLVEHVLGKDGVSGSIPLIGSRDFGEGKAPVGRTRA